MQLPPNIWRTVSLEKDICLPLCVNCGEPDQSSFETKWSEVIESSNDTLLCPAGVFSQNDWLTYQKSSLTYAALKGTSHFFTHTLQKTQVRKSEQRVTLLGRPLEVDCSVANAPDLHPK